MREADRRLASVARGQHGLVTRVQAMEAGLSPSSWRRRLRGGELVALHPGVARVASSPRSDEQRILAAVLAAGPDALASHTAAARLWGVPLDRWQPEVTVAGRTRSARVAGVAVHRPTDLADLQPARRARVPVTTPLRLLVDLGSAGPGPVERALDELIVSRRVSLHGVEAVLARHARPGRTGAGVLRAVLDRWVRGGEVPDSRFEVAVGALLARHGLPEPRFHHRIGAYEVDFAFPGAKVAVEVDGWATHGRREAFEADRARDLTLAGHGWLVARLTWWAVTNRPGACIGRLRRVLELRMTAA